ncbi:hypothetical protein CALCODRAFT_482480 [Calocera cornea HHB12733]|uniref:F-box domain-containing protein n=1 Tax=Calocera cornea HHB12733 TaxID=1353952 RepID=A0A165GRN8_9BASI|nr:hypothetical protein CALCODRAFT_482480 [Calocera cornea HHB12733]
MTIGRLPTDILAIIFEFVHEALVLDMTQTDSRPDSSAEEGVIDIFTSPALMKLLSTLCSVDRIWKNLTHSLPYIWAVIPILDPTTPLQSIEHFVQRSRCLSLTLFIDINLADLLHAALGLMERYDALPRVKSVNVVPLDYGDPTALDEQHFPRLKRLDLYEFFPRHLPILWSWLEEHAERLECLDLAYVYFPFDTFHVAHLPILSLPRLNRLRLDHADDWLSAKLLEGSLPSLTELHIYDIDFPMDQLPSESMPSMRILAFQASQDGKCCLLFRMAELSHGLESITFTNHNAYYHERCLERFRPQYERHVPTPVQYLRARIDAFDPTG